MRLQKSTTKYGNEHEAIAVYHMMKGVQKFCPIYTLAVGNAFGEAALLLSAGSPVRGAGAWGTGTAAHAWLEQSQGLSSMREPQRSTGFLCHGPSCVPLAGPVGPDPYHEREQATGK